ncbi:MAG: RNase P subunit p30 family protein [Candidatus Bathyarchaeota archaeon]
MGRFVDLHLNIKWEDAEKILSFLSKLGYGAVGLVSDLNGRVEDWKKIGESLGVDVVSRVNLQPSSNHELLNMLRKLRRRFEVIAVVCNSKHIARFAARDRRVDLLVFPTKNLNLFDDAEAKLASNSNACLELNVKHITETPLKFLPKVLFEFKRIVKTAKKYRVPVVTCSGATCIYEVKAPKDLASIPYILGLSEREALQTVSLNPKTIVEKNRVKLSKNFVGVGVYLLEKEGDVKKFNCE